MRPQAAYTAGVVKKPARRKIRRRTRSQRARAVRVARLRRMFWRFRTGVAVTMLMIVALVAAFALWRNPAIIAGNQAPVQFFQIATGPVGGTYFPIGQALASVISRPPGSVPCTEGEHCGVPGVIAVAKASAGSVANLRRVEAQRIDSALAQSDVANWAFSGARMFKKDGKLTGLRAIAGLYPEAVQLVAREGAEIEAIADLAGKRVAIGRSGSGPAANALEILRAFRIRRRQLKLFDVDASVAADMMLKAELDAFITIGGAPAQVVYDLIDRGVASLVPIEGPVIDKLLRDNKLFVRHTIHAGIYPGIRSLNTISVKALWVTHQRTDRQLIRAIARALWDENNRKILEEAHAKARLIQLETALDDIPIPLHDGARLFYEAKGLLAVNGAKAQ